MLDINENPNQPIPPRLDETLSYRTDWIAEGKDIVSDKGHKIASCEAAEDASGIVKAINNHDCLVYALHRLLNSQPYGRPEEWAETKEFAKEFLKQILEN